MQGLSVKATRGNAVLFYSMHPNGTVDPHSEHGSCPTLKVGYVKEGSQLTPAWLCTCVVIAATFALFPAWPRSSEQVAMLLTAGMYWVACNLDWKQSCS